MKYNELVQLYFERSNALQGYWTLYVVIIGGLLAFSSLRKQPDHITGLLVTLLYAAFAEISPTTAATSTSPPRTR